METLLIADSNEDFLLAMAEILQRNYHVLLCRDGKTALDILRQNPCDLILLDLCLPQLDGISLLEQARLEHICPTVLATTPLLSDYVMQAIPRLNIGYLVRKPCDLRAVAARVEDLLHPAEPVPPADDRQYLSGLLLQLGISPKLDGYRYLMECTLRFAARPDQAFTKELYPDVGRCFHRSGPQVERSIRNAMDIAWGVRDDSLWHACFSCGNRRPSSSAAISHLAELLHQR